MRSRVTNRILKVAEAVVTVLGLALVLVIEIPWFDAVTSWMSDHAKTSTVETVIVTLLVVLYFEHRRGADVVEDVAASLPKRTQESIYLGSPMDVYPLLYERMGLIKYPAQKRLDVIGMSLYTAWPSLEFELSKDYMNGWTLRFAAVGYRHRGAEAWIPDSWFAESAINLRKVGIAAESASLRSRGISLESYEYDFPPSLHGFRLANGDLFYSILKWGTDGKLTLENYTYDFVPAEDVSASANAMRSVFDSWFARITQSSKISRR